MRWEAAAAGRRSAGPTKRRSDEAHTHAYACTHTKHAHAHAHTHTHKRTHAHARTRTRTHTRPKTKRRARGGQSGGRALAAVADVFPRQPAVGHVVGDGVPSGAVGPDSVPPPAAREGRLGHSGSPPTAPCAARPTAAPRPPPVGHTGALARRSNGALARRSNGALAQWSKGALACRTSVTAARPPRHLALLAQRPFLAHYPMHFLRCQAVARHSLEGAGGSPRPPVRPSTPPGSLSHRSGPPPPRCLLRGEGGRPALGGVAPTAHQPRVCETPQPPP